MPHQWENNNQNIVDIKWPQNNENRAFLAERTFLVAFRLAAGNQHYEYLIRLNNMPTMGMR